MTTAAENEILVRTGPGTPMGEFMRQFWMPALMSSEVTADGDPVRFKLLGEQLIAFRDTGGRVGVFDHRCPHRCASLFFGRNEEGGIRCVYHGWKFDVDGNCLEMAPQGGGGVGVPRDVSSCHSRAIEILQGALLLCAFE